MGKADGRRSQIERGTCSRVSKHSLCLRSLWFIRRLVSRVRGSFRGWGTRGGSFLTVCISPISPPLSSLPLSAIQRKGLASLGSLQASDFPPVFFFSFGWTFEILVFLKIKYFSRFSSLFLFGDFCADEYFNGYLFDARITVVSGLLIACWYNFRFLST